MNKTIILSAALALTTVVGAQTYKVENPDLSNHGYVTFDDVPDGNYRVHVRVGGKDAASTVIRGESRRLFFESIDTEAGTTKDVYFNINKRDTLIATGGQVRIKPRERSKLNWDSKLTLEFNGSNPAVELIEIEPASNDVPTIFLCGNSTVVDQDYEPWASWGQMITRWFDDKVCVANYAESGESSNTFIAVKRLAKIESLIKPGDYIFMEFGHNDEKQKGPDKGPWLHFTKALKEYIRVARDHGATPVLVTPTQRRFFDSEGHLKDTHGEFPAAVKKLAEEEGVAIIDLQAMTTVFYETMGEEPSKKAFVHYPAGTFPGQTTAFADNTHFNPYGAYELAKCILMGIKKAGLPLAEHIKDDFVDFDPAHPDDVESFVWYNAFNIELEKPDGN